MAKLDMVTMAAIAALIAAVLLGTSLFGTLFENPRVAYAEAPLEKNKEFQLQPGEVYRYS